MSRIIYAVKVLKVAVSVALTILASCTKKSSMASNEDDLTASTTSSGSDTYKSSTYIDTLPETLDANIALNLADVIRPVGNNVTFSSTVTIADSSDS